jgi:MerR family transcriptional regulator, light-induced transcriptional regulator
MPLPEIARAAAAHRADIVALSFSSAFPRRQIPGLFGELRGALPFSTEIWAGGSGVRGIAPPDGVHVVTSLQDTGAALVRWRQAFESAAR